MVESHIAKVAEARDSLQQYLDILLEMNTLSPFPLSKNSIHLSYKVCDMYMHTYR
jgi:hypothetical protein